VSIEERCLSDRETELQKQEDNAQTKNKSAKKSANTANIVSGEGFEGPYIDFRGRMQILPQRRFPYTYSNDSLLIRDLVADPDEGQEGRRRTSCYEVTKRHDFPQNKVRTFQRSRDDAITWIQVFEDHMANYKGLL